MTNPKIKISIIVLVYNAESYLVQCIQSIIDQDLNNIEIICVNDGSPDNSLAILNNFAQSDNRIKIISHENHGISYSAQRGIDMAIGEYVYFIANDDYLLPNVLSELYNSAMTSNLDILTFDVITFKEETLTYQENKRRKKILNTKVYNGIDFFEILFNNNLFVAPEFYYLFRLEYLQKNNITFYEKVNLHEDVVFLPMAILLSKRIAYVPLTPYVYRIRAGSIKQSDYNIERLYNYFYLTERLVKFLNDNIEIISANKKTIFFFKKYIKDHYSVIVSKMLRIKPHIPLNIIYNQLKTLKVSTNLFTYLQKMVLIIFFKNYKLVYNIISLKQGHVYSRLKKLIL
ncbi:MAG: glycosyltransferase [Ignavibacteriales bacterium]|nr:glycosyltransferase [Ignavibacteriales bacterium]